MKKTLVLGASTKPERYAYKAITALRRHNHPVVAIAARPGQVADVSFDTGLLPFESIDTVTLYLGPANQTDYIDYIIDLKPRRVIFNPGTENPVFMEKLQHAGILPEIACTLVLLQTGQY